MKKEDRQPRERRLELFRVSADRAPVAVVWSDSGGRITYVNDKTCQILGYTTEELLDLHVGDIGEALAGRRIGECDHTEPLETVSTRFESSMRRKDGTFLSVDVATNRVTNGGKTYHVFFVVDISERKRADQLLTFTQSAIDRLSIACYYLTSKGGIFYANEEACRTAGRSKKEIIGLALWEIDSEFPAEYWADLWRNLVRHGALNFETTHPRADGSRFPVELTMNHIRHDDREYACAFIKDVSERKRVEEENAVLEMQLVQAQKMESMGRLAGGIAHDFNNMLSVILGYSDMIVSRISGRDPLLEEMREIQKAAEQARNITSQLLAFSTNQVIIPEPIVLGEHVTRMRNTLASLVGGLIDVQCFSSSDLGRIRFDPAQLNQVLINLVVNARDAMPDGGVIKIETKNVDVDEDHCRRHVGSKPGDYVLLEVSDTGSGIDAKTLEHIFEPFFTTKEVGKGPGLGLATVYGIIKQNDGFISVNSEVGRGTVFRLYLRRLPEETRVTEADSVGLEPVPVIPGDGTVLIVENDPMVRAMTSHMLQAIGYKVIIAESSDQAISICEDEKTSIDLLLTDVAIPRIKGTELGDMIRDLRPKIKILLMSGYAPNADVPGSASDTGTHVIQKPFGIADLARKTREAIESL